MTTDMDMNTLHASLRAIGGWADRPPEMVDLLDQILNTVIDEEFDGAIVPVLVSDPTPSLTYYAVSQSELEWRKLQPLLSAAVGITHSDFTGFAPKFVPSTDLERLLAAAGFIRIVEFSAKGNRVLGKRVAENLFRLVRNVKRRPNSEARITATTAQLLAEFALCLNYERRDRALEIIGELATSMRIDAVNIWFLRTRFHANFNEPEKIVTSEYFASLVNVRRPQTITADLIKSIYEVDLGAFEHDEDPASAVESFRNKRSKYGTVFREIPKLQDPEIVTAMLVSELAESTPNPAQIDHLREVTKLWSKSDKVYIDSLFELLPPVESVAPPISDLLHDAELALLWTKADPSVENIANWEAAFVGLSQSDRKSLLAAPALAKIYSDLSPNETQIKPPMNWGEWFEFAPTLEPSEVADLAERGVTDWSITEQLKTRAQISSFVSQIAQVDDIDAVYAGLPPLVTWVKLDPDWPNPSHIEIYSQLIFLLAFGGGTRDVVMEAVADLLTGIVATKSNDSLYREVLGNLGHLIQSGLTRRNIDWLVDVIEILMSSPVPDRPARSQFLSIAGSRFNEFRMWASPDQHTLIRGLLEIEGIQDLIEPLPESSTTTGTPLSPQTDWSGTIGIYTLNEAVGSRSKSILAAKYPNSDVRLNHDHENSASLTAMAERVDLFIICWNSAKHAATQSVLDIRRKLAFDTAYATGTSSIVSSVDGYLAKT